MIGCPDHTLDLAIARNIRLGGGRNFQIRLDAFNVFNSYIINARNASFSSRARPTSPCAMRSTTRTAAGGQPPDAAQRGLRSGNRCTEPPADGGTGGNYNRTVQIAFRFQF